ncbi:twin-arginine translocase subunit TatC [Vibrio salinus]|uniref:twin-arginine translocase subunit TatC n=1 Tax=Vibrio salinus TaxID=2899784 RepID=UPI001E638836|nr:twin-arginine translocase subunit TatC [Vibrio salinus]MCE0494951.1 twin-arginine translocase subunit TatC [Vibrio salinus]
MVAKNHEGTLIGHLIELRSRLLKMIGAIFFVFLSLVYFSDNIYEFIASPLIARLPEGTNMIATDVASPFFTPLKLTIVVALFISIPYVLYQIWGFIAPGLYKHEKKLILPLLVSSSFLFYLGVAFAYYVVFPLVFKFFTSITLSGVQYTTEISSYLNFVLALFVAFGMAFEVPVATILLCWTGITSTESLARKRPYIIVVAFVVGMLLTPPDIISQTLLAVPMCLLFEIGILIARFYERSRKLSNVEVH